MKVSKKRFIILLIASLSMLAVTATVFFVWVLPAITRSGGGKLDGLWKMTSGEFCDGIDGRYKHCILEFTRNPDKVFLYDGGDNGTSYQEDDSCSYSVNDRQIRFEFSHSLRCSYSLKGNTLTIVSGDGCTGVFERMADPRNEPIKPFDESMVHSYSRYPFEYADSTLLQNDETVKKYRIEVRRHNKCMDAIEYIDTEWTYDYLGQSWLCTDSDPYEGWPDEEWFIVGTWQSEDERAAEPHELIIHSCEIYKDASGKKFMRVNISFTLRKRVMQSWTNEGMKYQGTVELQDTGPIYSRYYQGSFDATEDSTGKNVKQEISISQNGSVWVKNFEFDKQ